MSSSQTIEQLSALLDEKLRPLVKSVETIKEQVDFLSLKHDKHDKQGGGDKIGGAVDESKELKDSANKSPRRLEKQRWQEAVRSARRQGYKIKGFYHTSSWREYWKNIIEEQLFLMDGRRPLHGDHELVFNDTSPNAPLPQLAWGDPHWASLLSVIDELMINVVGPNVQSLEMIQSQVANLTLTPRNRAKIAFHFNKTIERMSHSRMSKANQEVVENSPEYLSEAEVSTVTMLQDYCRAETAAGRKAFVFYVHNKGACCWPRVSKARDQLAVASWRDVMNTFNLEFPSICLRALLAGYSTCGYGSQMAHYTGNFWWADCGHVAALPALWNKFDAYAVEYFVMNVSKVGGDNYFMENCAYEAHHCSGDHYHDPCYRNTYMNKIQSFTTHAALPPLPTATINLTTNKDWCRKAWQKGPYYKQRGFNEWQYSYWQQNNANAA